LDVLLAALPAALVAAAVPPLLAARRVLAAPERAVLAVLVVPDLA
jgi:hypothetical protein